MSKKRYTLYLSRPLARKFDLVAQQRQGAKSALVEDALRASLEPQPHPGLDDGLARRLDELNRNTARIGRDVAIATETLALFVRYFLTITPPLPQSEQEPARLLGKERFQVFCVPCHGTAGNGRGKIVERGFLEPTSFHLKVTASGSATPPVGETSVGGAPIGALNAIVNVIKFDGAL